MNISRAAMGEALVCVIIMWVCTFCVQRMSECWERDLRAGLMRRFLINVLAFFMFAVTLSSTIIWCSLALVVFELAS